ncbi:MAG: OmpA family protein [Pseudomonadota bacterium]
MLRLIVLCFILFAGVGVGLLVSGVRFDPTELNLFAQRSATDPEASAKRTTEDDGNGQQGLDTAVRDLVEPLADELTDQAAPTDKPVFEAVRIDPDGVSVFAGRAGSNEQVHVMTEGRVVGSAKADAAGNWVIVTEGGGIQRDAKLSLETGERAAPEAQVADVHKGEVPRQIEAGASTSAAVQAVNERLMTSLAQLVDEARKTKPEPAKENQSSSAPAKPNSVAKTDAGVEPQDREVTDRVATLITPDSDINTERPVAGRGEDIRIPVPIQFVYRTAVFTDQGRRAVDLLRAFLIAKKPGEIVLTGHADERGTPQMNMELSRQRLEAVETYLTAAGFTGRLVLEPKGESEPFRGVDRTAFSAEDLFQLDRRVEIRLRGSQAAGRS